MNNQEYSFCIHSIAEKYSDYNEEEANFEGYNTLNVITFCPVSYWAKDKCLPDYDFSDELWEPEANLPEGYRWYLYVEETQWVSKKSKEEITKELTDLGFVENIPMQKFLSECWA